MPAVILNVVKNTTIVVKFTTAMSKPLEKLFGSRTRAKLLGWFFTHPGESFSVRQLASILGDDPSNLSKEMSRLESSGILVSTRERNLKRFTVSQACAFGPELKGLIQKTTGIIGRLRSALQSVKRIDFAFVYGSFARGDESAESDVDILIVGEASLEDLDKAFANLEKDFGRTINYILYSRSEYRARTGDRDAFLKEIGRSKKIWVIGKDGGLDTV